MVRSIFMLAEARGDSLQRATEGRELQKRTWQLHVSKAVYAMLHSTLLTGLMDNSVLSLFHQQQHQQTVWRLASSPLLTGPAELYASAGPHSVINQPCSTNHASHTSQWRCPTAKRLSAPPGWLCLGSRCPCHHGRWPYAFWPPLCRQSQKGRLLPR